MDNDSYAAICGPDFLDLVANQEAANGNDINAAYFRDRARQWRLDEVELREARARVSDLEARLAEITRTAQAA